MSHSSQPGSVMDIVKKRIGELEHAIQRLDFVKRHLNQNSTEIKSQIHSSISRHLETLRNRELRLLEEVDTVVGGKEEVLHRQQARLNKALGVLHSSLAHAATAGADEETAAKHIVQALEQLNSTDLKAESTPHVAFRADHVALRESILNYGRVDAKGLPLMTAFSADNKPSASLPRHLEEYEDTEHHIFYKALQGSNQVRVTMPKLSSRVEDWLQRPILQFSATAEPPRTPGSENAGTPVSQTTCAIQNWLSQIKHNPDVEEEDDFEIVDHSGSSQRESPMEEEKLLPECGNPETFVSMFHHIPRDVHLWLLQGSVPTIGPSDEELCAFFKHIPRDMSMWLIKARNQLESLDELKHGSWFRHIPTEMSTWLRRSHDRQASVTTQSSMPEMFSHISKDKSKWLRKESGVLLNAGQVQKSEDKKTSKASFMSADLEKYLMKRTSSQNPSSDSSIHNPIEVYISIMPSDTNFWLLQKDSDGVGAAAAANVNLGEEAASNEQGSLKFMNSSTNNISAWLLRPMAEEGMMDQQPPSLLTTSNYFSHISTATSDWLHHSSRMERISTVKPEISFRSVGDPRVWLNSASAAAFLEERTTSNIPSSPIDSFYLMHSHFTTSDWLLGRGGQGNRDCNSPLLSEKSWTGCSTESSLSSASTASSLHLPPSPTVITGQPVPPVDLAAWIYQECL